MGVFREAAAALAVAGMVGFAFGGAAAAAEQSTTLQRGDGMYSQSWFLESFLELREDLKEAAADGKRFAIIWEQRGCPYCRETHVVNFAKPEIRNYVRKNFVVLQLDIRGVREVTDFDGETMTEKALARKYGVRYTPTVTFYKAPPAGGAAVPGKHLELSRMTGYYRPFHFLSAFIYIRDRAYESQKFGAFVAKLRDERVKRGLAVRFP